MCFETVRLIFTLASLEGWYITSLDVRNAFRYGCYNSFLILVRGHYVSTTIRLHTPSRPPTSTGIQTVISSLYEHSLVLCPMCLRVDITRPYRRVLHLLYLDQLLSGPRVVTWGLLYKGSRCRLYMTPLKYTWL